MESRYLSKHATNFERNEMQDTLSAVVAELSRPSAAQNVRRARRVKLVLYWLVVLLPMAWGMWHALDGTMPLYPQ
jgi:hypothetical protein